MPPRRPAVIMSLDHPVQEVGSVIKVSDTIIASDGERHANTAMEVVDYDPSHFGDRKPGFGLKFVQAADIAKEGTSVQ